MTALRSALFMAWFLLLTAVMGIVFLPLLALPRKFTVAMARQWAAATLWGLKVFSGIDMRVRGPLPKGGALVASKHMSMWDTLALYIVLDDPGIVLKRELLRFPFMAGIWARLPRLPLTARPGPRRCAAWPTPRWVCWPRGGRS